MLEGQLEVGQKDGAECWQGFGKHQIAASGGWLGG